MIEAIDQYLVGLGLTPGWAALLAVAALAAGILLAGLLLHLVVSRWMPRLVEGLLGSTAASERAALAKRFGRQLSLLGPAVVFYASAELFRLADFPATNTVVVIVERLALSVMIVVITLLLSVLLDAFVSRYRVLELGKTVPLKSFTQVIKLVLLLVAAMLVLSTLLNKSPAAFFTGLGALSAVLIFVFREPILGLVASVKIASTSLIRLGDWIEMPKYGVDGNVTDISLTTVEVQNWDKTFVSVPTYAFLSESVKNWRGMSESGGRRIKRAIYIDMTSVRFFDEALAERLRAVPHLEGYLERAAADGEEPETGAATAELSKTNIGAFRAYLAGYLHAHPQVHPDLTFLVRSLQPTERGLPIEIYVFCRDQRWPVYEAIQADIVDHIIAMVPQFDLRIFQLPGGRRFEIDLTRA